MKEKRIERISGDTDGSNGLSSKHVALVAYIHIYVRALTLLHVTLSGSVVEIRISTREDRVPYS
jgi:hypothetical protein